MYAVHHHLEECRVSLVDEVSELSLQRQHPRCLCRSFLQISVLPARKTSQVDIGRRQLEERIGSGGHLEALMELLQDLTADDTEILIQSDDSLKYKVIFICGYLTRNDETTSAIDDDDYAQDPKVSSEFTDIGELSVPKFSTAYFVHFALKGAVVAKG